MGTLQKIFEKTLEDSFSFPVVGAKLIKRQLEKKSIILTDKQIDELEKKLQDINGDLINFDLDLDEEQNRILGVSDGEKYEIDIGGEKELDELYQEFVTKIEESVPEIIEEMTATILSRLKKDMPAMLKAHRKDMKSFEQRLQSDWKKPLDLFESFLVLAYEAGEEFNNEFRKDESERKNYVLEVLTRLHARACQITSEILVLLKSGFADGAHARWRTLHEITVVGSFIKNQGNEIAEKYLLHDNIESFRAANLFQKYCKELNDIPIPQDEYELIKATYEKLIARFGESYRNEYGWAASVLKKNRPTFSDIEKNTGLDHQRPYYKLASHNVHANPKGVSFKLGLTPSTQNILLAGPSNTGFTDPAQGAIISLGFITIALITARPTIDNLVLSNILSKLGDEIGVEFLKVQKEIENREFDDSD